MSLLFKGSTHIIFQIHVDKGPHNIHELYASGVSVKVTRFGTLAPPKIEGQSSICRQVNSF